MALDHVFPLVPVLKQADTMKRLAFLFLVLVGCTTGTEGQTEQQLACYDTGSGIKCVPQNDVPAGARTTCTGGDGPVGSESSDEGPSPSDDGTSVSSDTGNGPENVDGDDSDGDDSGASNSDSGTGCGASTSDSDGDGTPNGEDCDCGGQDDPTPPAPDTTPPA